MRVLYDVSVLGLAQRERWQRTGVFRVVDELARQLLRAGECELSFCCAAVPSIMEDALRYLGSDMMFASVPVKGQGGKAKPSGRFAATALQVVRTALRRGRSDHLASSEYKAADVFHAPAFYLPAALPRASRPKGFLTINDLIPILHPELCREGSTAFMEEALRSLTPDRWALCVSEATKRDLCNYLPSMPPERVFVTPLAASEKFHPCDDEAARASARAKYGVPDRPYFLSLSTLEPRKNMDHLIRCFGSVAADPEMQGINLVLVGEKGWKYEAIVESIAQTEARDRIILTGYVDDDDLAALYAGAICFVYPSLYEGFGLPPLEAMQCGTPVITSNTSSLPEVVGEAGIMVAPHDGDALADAILSLASNRARRSELAGRAITRAEQFSWKQCGQETVAAYRAALAA